jgi:hypothetical protein
MLCLGAKATNSLILPPSPASARAEKEGSVEALEDNDEAQPEDFAVFLGITAGWMRQLRGPAVERESSPNIGDDRSFAHVGGGAVERERTPPSARNASDCWNCAHVVGNSFECRDEDGMDEESLMIYHRLRAILGAQGHGLPSPVEPETAMSTSIQGHNTQEWLQSRSNAQGTDERVDARKANELRVQDYDAERKKVLQPVAYTLGADVAARDMEGSASLSLAEENQHDTAAEPKGLPSPAEPATALSSTAMNSIKGHDAQEFSQSRSNTQETDEDTDERAATWKKPKVSRGKGPTGPKGSLEPKASLETLQRLLAVFGIDESDTEVS